MSQVTFATPLVAVGTESSRWHGVSAALCGPHQARHKGATFCPTTSARTMARTAGRNTECSLASSGKNRAKAADRSTALVGKVATRCCGLESRAAKFSPADAGKNLAANTPDEL